MLRYYYTLRQLKFYQIYYRLIKKIKRYKSFLLLFLNLKKKKIKLGNNLKFNNYFFLKKNKSYLGKNKFIFLNKENTIDINFFPDTKIQDKLWIYNLNYFDFLNSNNDNILKDEYITFINKWIKNNSKLNIENDPYPLSLRIVNWIKWSLKNDYYDKKFLNSLYIQTLYLNQNLEYDLMGNHLFANIKALIFSGIYFDDDKINNIFDKSIKLLESQLTEQINEDGSHCELSPMYHSIILEDLIDIYYIFKIYNYKNSHLLSSLEIKILLMLNWLENMSFNNDLFFFNDTCNEIANNFNELHKYANNLKLNYSLNLKKNKYIYFLPNSGFVNLKLNDIRIIFDTGNIGYNLNPGHAHADCLSLELVLFSQKLFVNSGISTYENSNLRFFQRSTKSHNTVSVDNKNSSDIWSSFRVSLRAEPIKKKLTINKFKNSFFLTAAILSKNFSNNQIIHERQISVYSNSITIKDTINGKYKSAKSYFYLHPKIQIINYNKIKIDDIVISLISKNSEMKFIKSKWYPKFNYEINNNCLVLETLGNSCELTLKW